jgi:hypothetical protein
VPRVKANVSDDKVVGRLTPKQSHFVNEYMINGRNSGKAYQVAFGRPNLDGTCFVEGSKLLNHPKIVPFLVELKKLEQRAVKQQVKREAVTKETVIHIMAQIATADVRRLLDENGNLKPVHLWDDDIAAAVQSVQFDEVVVVDPETGVERLQTRASKIRFHPKVPAVDMLARVFDVYVSQPPEDATGRERADRVASQRANLLKWLDSQMARRTVEGMVVNGEQQPPRQPGAPPPEGKKK